MRHNCELKKYHLCLKKDAQNGFSFSPGATKTPPLFHQNPSEVIIFSRFLCLAVEGPNKVCNVCFDPDAVAVDAISIAGVVNYAV